MSIHGPEPLPPPYDVQWRCTFHKRDNAIATYGEYPTCLCWGAIRDSGAVPQMSCAYERMEVGK